MIILGIDPGTRITGFGIIQAENSHYTPLDFGCIKPPPQLNINARYTIIFDSVTHLIDTYKPSALAIETQFVNKNVQSAIKLGMARAVAIVAATKKGLTVHEYTPLQAKKAVTHGQASKEQVQNAISLLLCLKEQSIPEDAADALAIAICHLHREGL